MRDRFCVAGISFRQANLASRGGYALSGESYAALLADAQQMGYRSVFAISTCNRTEVYGYANDPHQLSHLLVRHTGGHEGWLKTHGYFLQGKQALHHFFRVAAGLDSQIIGDYEVQGQIKQAVAMARMHHMIGPVMDRTLNFVFQASKQVRTETSLSSGTMSVAYAAMAWLRQRVGSRPLQVLIIGAGKIGASLSNNLFRHLPQLRLTLCNRRPERAALLAAKIGADTLAYGLLPERIHEFDVIITATQSPHYIVQAWPLTDGKRRYVIDLGVPANVHADVSLLPEVEFADVDAISQQAELTMAMRMKQVSQAEAIIARHEQAFYQWLHHYQHAAIIRLFKQHITAWSMLDDDAMASEHSTDDAITPAVDRLVMSLKHSADKGCQVIEAYRHFLHNHMATAQHP